MPPYEPLIIVTDGYILSVTEDWLTLVKNVLAPFVSVMQLYCLEMLDTSRSQLRRGKQPSIARGQAVEARW